MIVERMGKYEQLWSGVGWCGESQVKGLYIGADWGGW